MTLTLGARIGLKHREIYASKSPNTGSQVEPSLSLSVLLMGGNLEAVSGRPKVTLLQGQRWAMLWLCFC